MSARKHIFKQIFLYGIFGVLIIFGLACIWLYSGTLTPAKTKAFQILPLPIALVNGSPLFINDFLFRTKLAGKLPTAQTGIGASDKAVFDQLVREELQRQLATEKNIMVSLQQVDSEYNSRAAQANLQGKNSFDDLLAGYGLSAAEYKAEVIAPELRLINLQIWYNSQPDLNPSAYSEAQNLLQKIKNGEDMAQLATSTSEDINTASLGGDLGFMDPARALPELREPLSAMAAGEARLLPSRYGLHIIRVEEKNGNNLHLRQIFLQTADFNGWLNQQTQKIKIKKLINF